MRLLSLNNNSSAYLILLHVLLLGVLFSIARAVGVFSVGVTSETLMHWDAGWYYHIKTWGYQYYADQQSSVGFFPLFPLVWKLLRVDALGMSAVNLALGVGSLAALARTFSFSKKETLLFASIPSLVFLSVPYSEALFFTATAAVLIGLYKQKPLLVIVGIFVASLIRSVSIFFIPAIVISALLTYSSRREAWGIALRNSILYSMASLSAFFVVAVVQWQATGVWFAYAYAQVAHWNHMFHLTGLPLATWGGLQTIWLDVSALWVGIAATVILGSLLVRYIIRSSFSPLRVNQAVVFSLVYMSLVSVYLIFFNPLDDSGNTILFSLHRYVLATPFAVLVLWWYFKSPISYRTSRILILSTLPLWFIVSAHTVFSQTRDMELFGLLYLATTLVYLWCYIVFTHLQARVYIFPALYVLQLMVQIYLFDVYLHGRWLG